MYHKHDLGTARRSYRFMARRYFGHSTILGLPQATAYTVTGDLRSNLLNGGILSLRRATLLPGLTELKQAWLY